MRNRIILSRVPFRLPLGGGSTDLPSYYEKYGGFIFAVTVNLYMDLLIKEPIVDDYIHMHYLKYEAETAVQHVKHTIGREALRMVGISKKVLLSFNADTPAGTGLGSSGACAVALLKGLSLFKGREMSNREAAEQSFKLTKRLELPDGKQDPYVCAFGGFVVLRIGKNGAVRVIRPHLKQETVSAFTRNVLLFYTDIRRDSSPLLAAQNTRDVFALKHRTKAIGEEIYRAFLKNDLRRFGELLHEHWLVKKTMSDKMTTPFLEEIYDTARRAGALGGKIIGAGGGGYFMFYCPSERIRARVREAMRRLRLREVSFKIDERGARAEAFAF